MKRLTIFCVALLTAATTFATVTYELNGGITNDYGWQGKGDMFAAFMTDAGATGFETLEYYMQQADPLGSPNICSKLTDASPAIKMTDKWGWLETYIMAAHADQSADGASALTAGGSGAAWRYAVGAFFISGQRTGWPKSADFSTLGQVAAFMPAWKHAFANPAEPKDSVALYEPYKEGYTFNGWYTTADFSGEKVTYVDSTTTGTLYAKFIHKVTAMTCAEAHLAAMLLQSGETGTDSVLVTGYVTNTDGKISKGQQKFWMDDVQGTTKTFYAYWGNMPEGEETPLHIGDKVTIKGVLLNYADSIPEVKNGSITILERVKIDTIEFTVCEAVEKGELMNSGDYTADAFKVAGMVTSLISTNDTYKTATFTLTCEDNDKVLNAYNITMENGFCAVGDSVLVIGCLTKYDNTAEIVGAAEVTKKGITTTITFDKQGGTGGTDGVGSILNYKMPQITIPTREGYLFVGYFTEDSVQYYNADGISLRAWDKDDETFILYAHWYEICDCETTEQAISADWYLTHMYDARCTELTCTFEKDNDEYIYTNVEGEKVKVTTDGSLLDFYYVDPSSIVFDSIYVSKDGYYCMTWYFHQDVVDGLSSAGSKTQVWVNDMLAGEITTYISDEDVELDEVKFGGIELYADYPNKIKLLKVNGWPMTRGIQLDREVTANVAVATGCEGMGTVTGGGSYIKGNNVTITATPNAGYHFVEWSDGAGKPVRDIYLTSDTTIYATFALGEYGGKCGSNLYWEWNNDTLTITGTGDMDVVNYQTWEDYNITISSISFPEGMTSISSAAFTDVYAIAPSQAYLQTLQTANHQIVCIQFLEPVCNDIVWTGTYNDWSTKLYELLYFQPVPNYDGWYYVNVPITNSANDVISWGKPVQLANDGSFSWDYQAGDVNSWEVIYGTITVSVGYTNESNLSNCVYDDGPLVLISKYFKNDPCTGKSDIKAHLASYTVQSIVIPASVTYIGENAFAGWSNLTHFEYKGTSLTTDAGVLPNIVYLSYIRANAQVLEEIYTADTVVVSNGYVYSLPTSTYYDLRNADNTSIVMSDFNDLRVLYLPDGLVWIGDDAFINDKHLEGILIPKDVISIGESAFENCRSLQSVTFAGTKVQAIGDWAFYNCHELQSITIPEGVTAIGKSAFYGCTYLTDLNLPSTVQSIADNGFALCSKLKKISVSAVTPPTIDAKTFEDVDKSIPLCVPVGTRQSYADAPHWQEFFNIQETTPTAVSTTSAADTTMVQKVLRNGQVLILRGDKVFTVMGVEVR